MHGVLGVGRLGNYMVNEVAAVMFTVRGYSMRRFATEVELEYSVPPKSRMAFRAILLRLSNCMGKSR